MLYNMTHVLMLNNITHVIYHDTCYITQHETCYITQPDTYNMYCSEYMSYNIT